MTKKQQIIYLYYEKELTQTKIANYLNVSKAYITKVIKDDKKYILEKHKRKEKNKLKNKEETKKYVKEKRENEKRIYESIKKQHEDAINELSSRTFISNKNFRNWNSSLYLYNSKSKTYNLKRNILVTADVPKKIDWKGI